MVTYLDFKFLHLKTGMTEGELIKGHEGAGARGDKPLATRTGPRPIWGPGWFKERSVCAAPTGGRLRAACQVTCRGGAWPRVEPEPFEEGAWLGGGARCWEAAVASGHVRGGPCPGRGRGLGEEAGLMPRRLQLLGVRLWTHRASAVPAAPGCYGLRVELPCSRTVGR